MLSKEKFSSRLLFCVLSGAALSGVNRMISSGASARNLLKPEKGSFYHHPAAGAIYYEKTGSSGPALLLLHDASVPGSSGFEWKECVSLLSRYFTVYTVDLPGCGRSEKRAMIYTNYLMVQALTAFIRDVTGEKPYAAAAGLSASFMLCAACAQPELVKDLILIDPPSLKSLSSVPDALSKLRFKLMNLPVLGTAVFYILTHRRNIEFEMNEHYYYNPFHVTRRAVDAFYEAAHRGNGLGRHYQASLDGHYLNWDIKGLLSRYKGPVHILYGDKLDRAESTVKAWRRCKPDLSFEALHNTKRLPHMEDPSACAAQICRRFKGSES